MQRAKGLIVLIASVVFCVGCGKESTPAPVLPPPTPSILSLSPSSAVAGSSGFTLTVNGTNLLHSSVVIFNGNRRFTTYVSSTQVTAAILATDVSSPGQVVIAVSNSGRVSAGATFSIVLPVPAITSLSPSHVQAGAAPFVLTVNGSGFIGASQVAWNGTGRNFTLISTSQLSVAVSASEVAVAGQAQLMVANPNGTSSAAVFTIDPLTSNPIPTISSLSDSEIPVGWPGFPLSIKGSGFVAGSMAQLNGANRPTTVLSSNLLTAAIPATDLAQTGNPLVTIFNPLPGGGSSGTSSLSIQAVPTGAFGVIERSSLATDLTQPNADSNGGASISADGRYVAFASNATNLVPGGTNAFSQIFLRDACIGAPPDCTRSITLLSVSSSGVLGDGYSFSPAISATGRFIAFSSDATNLVAGDTNGFTDVFVRDTCIGVPSGCKPSTTRVSLDNAGQQILLANVTPSISGDGRFVVFASGLDDYYYGIGTLILYLRDTCAGAGSGCTSTTIRVDVTPSGTGGDGSSGPALLSSNGRYVAFASTSTDLVSPNLVFGQTHVFLRDTCLGASGCTPSTTLVTTDRNGDPAFMGGQLASVTADGRYVGFLSQDGNIVAGDTNGFQDVFVRDTCNGAPAGCTPSTTRISLADNGSEPNSQSYAAAISATGRYVAFASEASNLVAGDVNGTADVFVRDTCLSAPAGCTPSTTRVSVALDGAEANNSSELLGMTADGHYLVLTSPATNLAPGDTNGTIDVFLARTNVP